MKGMSILSRASDRMATREELCQVMDLFEKITTDQGVVHSSILEFSLPFAGREASADSTDLWLDICEENASPQDEDARLEYLAALFAERSLVE